MKNDDLREEWDRYRDQTAHHIEIVEGVLAALGLDPATETPGRLVARHIGASLVKAMEMAGAKGTPEAAELVAAECVTLAETKDHLNWELIGQLAQHFKGEQGKVLKDGVRRGRRPRGRAPLPHQRLGSGTVDRLAGDAGGATAAGGAEGRQDGYRRSGPSRSAPR